jgi:hypothetical protein
MPKMSDRRFTERMIEKLVDLTQPWTMVGLTALLFWGMSMGMGIRYIPTAEDLKIQDELQLVQQRPEYFDPRAAQQMDDLLQQNGWVSDIFHSSGSGL